MDRINVDWLNFHPDTVTHPGMWDDTFLRELLAGVHGPVPGYGNVVVVPGRYHVDDVAEVNRWISRYPGVLVIVTADEESVFPADELQHENMIVWVQTQRPGRYAQWFHSFPLGYPPGTRDIVAEAGYNDAAAPFFFAGQDTHQRRHDAIQALSAFDVDLVVATEGFTLGLPREEYIARLVSSRTAPCPSGPETQETFRMWEAIQAGSVPIVDIATPRGADGYWDLMFRSPETPIPYVTQWDDIGAVIDQINESWPHRANMIQAWWSRYRRGWAKRLSETLLRLEGESDDRVGDQLVTVIVPTSPVPSNPDTSVITETIESVRDRLPGSQIVITIDGVRVEQWQRTEAYHEYTRRLLWLVNNKWRNVTAVVHEVHRHQHQMTMRALQYVDTPLLLYVEHDCPLTGDWPVAKLVQPIIAGEAYIVRMNHEHEVHAEHRHLLAEPDPTVWAGGVNAYKTIQWSQRPHLALVSKYAEWLDQWFDVDERSMIEDRMHSVAQRFSWGRHKILLYAPDGNEQRSIHRDSRGADPKWVTT